MITVTPPVKYSVSPVLVMIVTDGAPNWRSTSDLGVPVAGNRWFPGTGLPVGWMTGTIVWPGSRM